MFLLTTPMSSRRIAGGICWSQIIPFSSVELAITPLMLLLALESAIAHSGVIGFGLLISWILLIPALQIFGCSCAVILSNRFKKDETTQYIMPLLSMLVMVIIFFAWIAGPYSIAPKLHINWTTWTSFSLAFVGILLGLIGILLWPVGIKLLEKNRTKDLETEGQHFEN
jgi:lysylphosphatidylglycerol synthetase-like protein (DUF2156 family)